MELKTKADDGKDKKRTKCALKPGRSLMDWIRLGSSGVDLSGTKGAICPVSHSELAQHCRQEDAWMAIRGRVFNVSHYMEYHPGGCEELMKGAGIDATKLFEEIHSWVNYEQLLSKCYVGPLRSTATIDITSKSKPTRIPNSSPFLVPDFFKSKPRNLQPPTTNSSSPRFDWIQKMHDIVLIFYTKAFSNPSLILRLTNEKCVEVEIILNNITHLYKLNLLNAVTWPPTVKVFHETGKIEIIFIKDKTGLWTDLGEFEHKSVDQIGNVDFEFETANCMKISKDSFALSVLPKDKVILHTEVGGFIRITASIQENPLTRSYTPIPASYTSLEYAINEIYFLIKSYELGNLSKYMFSENVVSLNFSRPKGTFSLSKLANHNRIILLAAGSGITPMLGIIDHVLKRVHNKVVYVDLVYFNQTKEDIWCFEMLEEKKHDARLRTRYVLSKPNEDWHGDVGHISAKIVSETLELCKTSEGSSRPYACVCGPKGFNECTVQLLQNQGLSEEFIHVFQ